MGVILFDNENNEHKYSINFWHWRAIVEVVRSLDLLPDEAVGRLHQPYCGFGLDAAQAKLVGDAVRRNVLGGLKPEERLTLDADMRLSPASTTETDDGMFHQSEATVHRNYGTNREVLEAFADFCTRSSGFIVS